MARLWSCGFEENSVTSGVEFANAISTPTISTTTIRTGTYALRISSLGSTTAKGMRHLFAGSPGNGPFFVRVYLNVATRPSAANRIIFLNDTDNQTTPMVWINLLNDGTLTLNDEDGAIGSASGVLSLGTWYRVEIKVDRTAAAGSQTVEGMVNGSVFATSATRDLSAGVNVFACGGNLAAEAQTTGDWFFDDIAVNDSTTGGTQTTYPGASGWLHLRPSASGDNAAWILGTGSTFAEIDEVTPDDVTTYIAANTATGVDATDCSDFNLDNTPAAIGSGDTINVVAVGNRSTLSDATGGDPNAVLRIKASASGTVQESANLGGNATTWWTHNANAPFLYKLVLYDLPGASTTAWTKADLDTAQIGVRISTSDTHNYQVSALWLGVDFTPAAAATKAPPLYQKHTMQIWRKR